MDGALVRYHQFKNLVFKYLWIRQRTFFITLNAIEVCKRINLVRNQPKDDLGNDAKKKKVFARSLYETTKTMASKAEV